MCSAQISTKNMHESIDSKALLEEKRNLERRLCQLEIELKHLRIAYDRARQERRFRASIEVAGIAELRELILSFLPEKDLLLAQKLNKVFRQTIQTSSEFRRALFFDGSTTHCSSASNKAVLNPILTGRAWASEGYTEFRAPIDRVGWTFSFNKYHLCSQEHYEGLGWDVSLVPPLPSLQLHINFDTKAAAKAALALSGNGSWVDMYLTQPACAVYVVVSLRKARCIERQVPYFLPRQRSYYPNLQGGSSQLTQPPITTGHRLLHEHEYRTHEVFASAKAPTFGQIIKIAASVYLSDSKAIDRVQSHPLTVRPPGCTYRNPTRVSGTFRRNASRR